MLLKWLLTIMSILWLIQALRPYFEVQAPPPPPPRPKSDSHARQAPAPEPDDDSEYIDYEEIK